MGWVSQKEASGRFGFCHLMPDGLYINDIRKAILWYRAAARDYEEEVQGESLEGVGNIRFRRGGLEFWYKPDFDWSERNPDGTLMRDGGRYVPKEVMCGLFSASLVRTNPRTNTKTRGVQMYVFRNTSGDLRVTRIYYEAVGHLGITIPKVCDPETKQLIDIREYRKRADTCSKNPNPYKWPPAEIEVDPKIAHARTDAFVPYDELKHWRAHEWHHVAIRWDDTYGGTDGKDLIKVWTDGIRRNTLPHPIPAAPGQHEFCVLNEDPPQAGMKREDMRPKDQLTVGCLDRLQSVTGGVFKFRKRIQLAANGTIDDLRLYDGTGSAGTSLGAPPERFAPGVATYENRFDLRDKLDPASGTGRLELCGLACTTYLPKSYERFEQHLGSGAVRASLKLNGRPVRSFVINSRRSPGGMPLVDGSGRPIVVLRGDRLTYTIDLRAASFNHTGIAVDTPAVDDVQLSYFLPVPEYLYQRSE
jgi:hypothetical protein